MHAIWLTFSKKDREYLKKIIDELSDKYHSPKFEPHITVYGLIDSDLSFIDNIVNGITQDSKSFFVNKLEILQSENLWKTIYIELKMNRQLEEIHNKLKEHFEKISKYEFKPHISLIYKILTKDQKIKIINELCIKEEFMVDKLVIQKFFSNIEKWQIVKEFSLN